MEGRNVTKTGNLTSVIIDLISKRGHQREASQCLTYLTLRSRRNGIGTRPLTRSNIPEPNTISQRASQIPPSLLPLLILFLLSSFTSTLLTSFNALRSTTELFFSSNVGTRSARVPHSERRQAWCAFAPKHLINLRNRSFLLYVLSHTIQSQVHAEWPHSCRRCRRTNQAQTLSSATFKLQQR